MAFCTSCGSKMGDDSQFCPTCGAHAANFSPKPEANGGSQPATAATAAQLGNAPGPVRVQPVPVSGSGGGVLKVVLVVVVILVGLGLLSLAGIFWAAYKVKNAVRVEQSGETATVKTPWGTVSSNEDPAKVARDLGVDVYPGAEPIEGASAVRIGNLSVGTVQFETSDPIEKVERFYKVRFPNSNIDVADENRHTLAMMTSKGMVNINLERSGPVTKISISRTGGSEPHQSE